MEKIYPSKAAAMRAAQSYRKENGGIIFDDVTTELAGDDNRILGTYGVIVVGTGIGTEPFGDSWEDFYFEPDPRGGSREGSGRKRLGKTTVSYRILPSTRDRLQELAEIMGTNPGAVIDSIVKAFRTD